jgi:hypothetical protein
MPISFWRRSIGDRLLRQAWNAVSSIRSPASRTIGFDQIIRTRQAPDMAGEDVIIAVAHEARSCALIFP